MQDDSSDDANPDRVTIALTGRDLDDLQRLLSLLAKASVSVAVTDASGTALAHSALELAAKAREILASRERRFQHFSKAIFGEPAWEMLLMLYVMATGQRQTVTRLTELSGASRTTAMRWIEYLERDQLVSREPHPTDKRIGFVRLTDKGRRALEAYLRETLTSRC